MALPEMVMVVWLILKGFNPSVIASGSANSEYIREGEKNGALQKSWEKNKIAMRITMEPQAIGVY